MAVGATPSKKPRSISPYAAPFLPSASAAGHHCTAHDVVGAYASWSECSSTMRLKCASSAPLGTGEKPCLCSACSVRLAPGSNGRCGLSAVCRTSSAASASSASAMSEKSPEVSRDPTECTTALGDDAGRPLPPPPPPLPACGPCAPSTSLPVPSSLSRTAPPACSYRRNAAGTNAEPPAAGGVAAAPGGAARRRARAAASAAGGGASLPCQPTASTYSRLLRMPSGVVASSSVNDSCDSAWLERHWRNRNTPALTTADCEYSRPRCGLATDTKAWQRGRKERMSGWRSARRATTPPSEKATNDRQCSVRPSSGNLNTRKSCTSFATRAADSMMSPSVALAWLEVVTYASTCGCHSLR